MARVRLLSKEVAELIAAGEVIDRPASIVKELLENSIDSGANIITLEIKGGGSAYIRVTDNGCGMSADDVSTAFLRHATSKISTSDDLNHIMTLGFRGEALAAISAVAKVDLMTKETTEQYGVHYVVEGGMEQLKESSGCPDGTTIVVRDLFFNVPARKKFLKKDVTEGNAVSMILHKIVLSHPEISFKYIRENRQELYTSGDGKLLSSIYAVYGRSFSSTLLPVEYTLDHITIQGFTVKPLYTRSNRSFQNFYINGRYVRSVTCTTALEEAYQNTMMTGKFPACILNIVIAPDIIDVNVHPAKVEVRFSNERPVYDAVFFAVKNALLAEGNPKNLELDVKSRLAPSSLEQALSLSSLSTSEELDAQYSLDQEVLLDAAPSIPLSPSKIDSPVKEDNDQVIYSISAPLTEEDMSLEDFSTPDIKSLNDFQYISEESLQKKDRESDLSISCEGSVKTALSLDDIHISGEIFHTYVVVESGDNLFLIDKHAAHERIIFEKLQMRRKALDCQMFLTPVEIVLSPEETETLKSDRNLVEKLGFAFSCTDGVRVKILGYPSCLKEEDAGNILMEIAQNLLQNRKNPQPEQLNDLYHMIACKAAIKANDHNDLQELQVLAQQVLNNENLRYCPHGRPVIISLTRRDLEKQFKRVI